MKPKYTFEVRKGVDDALSYWWWRCIHKNGEKLMHSETYTRKANAKKSMLRFIEAVKKGEFEVKGV